MRRFTMRLSIQHVGKTYRGKVRGLDDFSLDGFVPDDFVGAGPGRPRVGLDAARVAREVEGTALPAG